MQCACACAAHALRMCMRMRCACAWACACVRECGAVRVCVRACVRCWLALPRLRLPGGRRRRFGPLPLAVG
eukprot:11347915-Alexandrium_andersonii.AAC.1